MWKVDNCCTHVFCHQISGLDMSISSLRMSFLTMGSYFFIVDFDRGRQVSHLFHISRMFLNWFFRRLGYMFPKEQI